ncbi:MARVEL domain-containing protein [Mycena indigotica]|uniref:MARVEL domain-containing protein n=1 Tax=Mycena indigotica TaxID=2126181 RepID=A0A8H6VSP1_9AGAR|nr:MARVEL domain-containing protein [Mycena indigotica]KAF7288618.1 MARVEL domain-containing protein [Mycena indigotica]
MVALPLVRLVVLSVALLFAVAGLGLGAALTSTTESLASVSLTYASLAIAAAVLTLISVVPMLVLERIRPGGPTSWLAVEIPVLLVLSILWLATGGESANVLQALDAFGYTAYCSSSFDGDNTFKNICGETRGIAAVGFLNWALLMGYGIMLLVFAIQATSRKQPGVWTTSVAGLADLPPPQPAGAHEKAESVPQSYNPYAGSEYVPPATTTGGTVQAGAVHA